MVQFRVPPLRESGLQASDVMLSTVIRRRAIDAACVLPFNVAVSVAVWSKAIVPAVAVKVAVVDAAATTTDPGTVSAAVLLDSVTVLDRKSVVRGKREVHPGGRGGEVRR